MKIIEQQLIEKSPVGHPPQLSSVWQMVPEKTAVEAWWENPPYLAMRLESLREQERSRLARDLHDEMGPLLTALNLNLGSIEAQLAGFIDDPRAKLILEQVCEAKELANLTIQTVQDLALQLRAAKASPLGLVTGMQWEISRFEKRTGTTCSLRAPREDPALPSSSIMAFHRILREALTNIARHAAATVVEVSLEVQNQGCRLVIRDNGQGFNLTLLNRPDSLGLLGMQERARFVGGSVAFSSQPGKGTTLTAWIPTLAASKEDKPDENSDCR